MFSSEIGLRFSNNDVALSFLGISEYYSSTLTDKQAS